MIKADIVEKALKDFPDSPTQTLAKMIFKQHPSVFDSSEQARSMIRYRRGNNGNAKRNEAKANHKETFRRNGKAGFKIPKSDARVRRNYNLVDGTWGILSDIHIPYHDEEALEIALSHCEEVGVDHILLNGDTCDCYNISFHEKDPEERDLANELYKTREFLAHLRERFPSSKIVYKIGNHEARWERYLATKAPELIGVQNFEMYYVLDFPKWGVELVESMRKIKAGKNLTIVHGHEVRNSGVYPARSLLQRTHTCAIAGHNHRTSNYNEKTSDGKYISAWTTGCLCDMQPEYMPINQWNHGFAILELKGKDFTVHNKRIVNGVIK